MSFNYWLLVDDVTCGNRVFKKVCKIYNFQAQLQKMIEEAQLNVSMASCPYILCVLFSQKTFILFYNSQVMFEIQACFQQDNGFLLTNCPFLQTLNTISIRTGIAPMIYSLSSFTPPWFFSISSHLLFTIVKPI